MPAVELEDTVEVRSGFLSGASFLVFGGGETDKAFLAGVFLLRISTKCLHAADSQAPEVICEHFFTQCEKAAANR